MTKFTKLTIFGSSIIFIIVFLLASSVIAVATKPDTFEKRVAPIRDTIVVEKKVYLKADTVKIPVPCKRFHCESELKPKPKPEDDSIISTQTTPQ